MNYNNIKKLLDRFYAGETTLKEEDLLREFFLQDEVPESLKADQLQFGMYAYSKEEEVLDASFDEALFAKMEAGTEKTRSIHRWVYSLSGVAAAALIAIMLWAGGIFSGQEPLPGTINNPQLAFAETQKALMMVSSNLNQGLQPVQHASAELYRPIKQMAKIKTMSQSVRQVETFGVLNQAYQLIRPVGDVPQ